jgi:hypothetical protein
MLAAVPVTSAERPIRSQRSIRAPPFGLSAVARGLSWANRAPAHWFLTVCRTVPAG